MTEDKLRRNFTEKERTFIFLRYVQGLPKSKIADLLNVSPKDVDNWTQELEERLSDILKTRD